MGGGSALGGGRLTSHNFWKIGKARKMGWEIYPANSKPIIPSFPSFDQYAVLEASQGGLKPKIFGFFGYKWL